MTTQQLNNYESVMISILCHETLQMYFSFVELIWNSDTIGEPCYKYWWEYYRGLQQGLIQWIAKYTMTWLKSS